MPNISIESTDINKLLPFNRPLIHCITNEVTIESVANCLLCLNAAPIMADYPLEIATVTDKASALLLNIGQLDNEKVAAMRIAIKTAKKRQLPIVLDLVGVAGIDTRLDLANELIQLAQPTIIKGNYSELRAFSGLPQHGQGVDSNPNDEAKVAMTDLAHQLQHLSPQSVYVATGATDLLVADQTCLTLQNGVAELTRITGTGDMAGGLMAAFATVVPPIQACIYALSYLNISAEHAVEHLPTPTPLGSFKQALHDQLSLLYHQSWLQEVQLHDEAKF